MSVGKQGAMRKADFFSGIGLFAFTLVMIFVIIPREVSRGTWYGLSPYTIPTILLIGIMIFSLALVAKAIIRPESYEGMATPLRLPQLGMFGLIFTIVVLGVVVTDVLGYWVGGPLLILSAMLFMGERKALRLVLTPVVPVVVVYVLANYVLRTPLP